MSILLILCYLVDSGCNFGFIRLLILLILLIIVNNFVLIVSSLPVHIAVIMGLSVWLLNAVDQSAWHSVLNGYGFLVWWWNISFKRALSLFNPRASYCIRSAAKALGFIPSISGRLIFRDSTIIVDISHCVSIEWCIDGWWGVMIRWVVGNWVSSGLNWLRELLCKAPYPILAVRHKLWERALYWYGCPDHTVFIGLFIFRGCKGLHEINRTYCFHVYFCDFIKLADLGGAIQSNPKDSIILDSLSVMVLVSLVVWKH